MTAFYNAGGRIELAAALNELMKRGLQMPGATCGLWGVCGAVSSLGAALSIIDETGPLSADSSWGKHMEFIFLRHWKAYHKSVDRGAVKEMIIYPFKK